jgi:hypothetical protein
MTHVMMRSKHTKPSRRSSAWQNCGTNSLTKGPKGLRARHLQTLVKEEQNDE